MISHFAKRNSCFFVYQYGRSPNLHEKVGSQQLEKHHLTTIYKIQACYNQGQGVVICKQLITPVRKENAFRFRCSNINLPKLSKKTKHHHLHLLGKNPSSHARTLVANDHSTAKFETRSNACLLSC